MKLILVGACYVDTILSVPHFPGEDDKLRATSMQVRRGGNCPNAIEVMQQLAGSDDSVQMHLVSCLPDIASPSAAMIADSLSVALPSSTADPDAETPLATCIFRAGYTNPASCYIIRSAATGSRTIVNHNNLPEMTVDEFQRVVARMRATGTTDDAAWWHFEGRIPATLLQCIALLRQSGPRVTISVEVEKPGRAGLRALAALADIVFYSKSWAASEGYTSSVACLEGEAALSQPPASASRVLFCTWGDRGASAWHAGGVVTVPAPHVPADKIIDAVGAGDTFTAGILYKLSTSTSEDRADETIRHALEFAVRLASRKIQLDGFQGIAT